ncbi:hypothetical protein D9C01_13870, partial [Corynebacterium diphtheriae]
MREVGSAIGWSMSSVGVLWSSVAQRVQADAELGAVGPQGLDLGARGGIRDRLVDVQRRGVVVLR